MTRHKFRDKNLAKLAKSLNKPNPENLGSWTDGNGNWLEGRLVGDEIMTTSKGKGVAFWTIEDWNSTIDELIASGWIR